MRPRGARRVERLEVVSERISISTHTPLWGVSLLSASRVVRWRIYFNLYAPVGSVFFSNAIGFQFFRDISTHALTCGISPFALFSLSIYKNFNPCARVGRVGEGLERLCPKIISIHALLWGASVRPGLLPSCWAISTYTTTWGASAGVLYLALEDSISIRVPA